MRSSKTRARLRNNEVVRICALGHFIPSYIRHAAHFGFDCIWLDLEHRSMHEREVQALLAYFHLYDIDCMVRPPTLEKTRLYRYLEDGATGLMIPHVSTPEKAQMLADAVKFPPLGRPGPRRGRLGQRLLSPRRRGLHRAGQCGNVSGRADRNPAGHRKCGCHRGGQRRGWDVRRPRRFGAAVKAFRWKTDAGRML